MSSEPSLSEWFARLQWMAPGARESVLDSLEPGLAARLRSLLAADAEDDAAIVAAIAAAPSAMIDVETTEEFVGAWRVRGELGRGGMGVVLLGEREFDGTVQRGAIKLMQGRVHEADRTRFRQERRILATLDHPEIARLIDGGETASGQPFLVTELVRGETLAAHLRAGPIERTRAVGWIERIAGAVQHAHQHLVIHRDLKPANVMVTEDGSIKLLDFGVAKLIDPDTGDVDASTRVFTPGYASPEQRAGRAVDTRTDVYSLGRLLAEMIGAAPRDRELNAMVDRATRDDPAERYPTMAAFRDDLEAWRRGLPVQAASMAVGYRLRKWLQRHPLGTALALIALTVISTLAWRWIDALAESAAARIGAEQARMEAERQLDRSRAVVDFYARMFAGVAPEHARGQALAPSELLARAERLLDESPPTDPVLRAELSASLGVLYQRIGDGSQAVRLLQDGLSAAQPMDAYDGLQRANHEHTLALILFDLGRIDESLAAAERARALRTRFAPDNAAIEFATEILFGQLYLGARRHDDARSALVRAQALHESLPTTAFQDIDLWQLRATLAIDEGRFDEAAQAASQALMRIKGDAASDPTRTIELERTLARAQQGLGNLDAAADAFARAIDAQRRFVGDRGTRAMGLHNDQAVLFATLGRFRSAITAYGHAAEVYAASGGPAPDRNPRHQNNLCDAYSGLGRYDEAETFCARALALLAEESRSEDDPERLIVESNLARARGYAGTPGPAVDTLVALRDRARAAQGPESFGVTLQEFRAIRLALVAGRNDEARTFATRTLASIETVFPNASPWRVRGWRARALVAMADREWIEARAALDRAEQEAKGVLSAEHPLRAQIALDRAIVHASLAETDAARIALAKALPPLRDCCDEREIDRALAESLAVELGGIE